MRSYARVKFESFVPQKQYSGVNTDDEVLQIREAKLRVVAERVGLRRLHVLAPRLRSLTLDGSAIASLRDLGIGLVHLKVELGTYYHCHFSIRTNV